jgi:endo-1,4-beta-xylanase
MAITIANLGNVERNSTFNTTTSVVADGGETIDSLSITPIGGADSGVTATAFASTLVVRTKGQYTSLYDNDVLSYNDGTPNAPTQTANTWATLPASQKLFSVVQDSRTSITKQYQVTVNYTLSGVSSTENITIDQIVESSERAFQNALHEYLADVVTPVAPTSALASGKSKYLGCNNTGTVGTSSGRSSDLDFPHHYTNFWNSVSAGNPTKWKSVETNQGEYDFEGFDYLYKWTKSRGMPFYWHTMIWGASSALPSWFSGLSEADSKQELDDFLSAVSTRFPNIDGIQTVNEIYGEGTADAHQSNTTLLKNQFGGAGSTGYDWLIYLFQRARHYFPNAKLWLNDFGILSNATKRQAHIDACNILKNNGNLIDAVGCQSHYFNLNQMTATTLQNSLDDITTQTGLPIMITELDLSGYDYDNGGVDSEALQRERYERLFPILWNHSNVERITIWGYILGETWRHDQGHITGFIDREGNNKRSALTYLEEFMATAT